MTSAERPWPVPDAVPVPPPGEVHIWRCAVERPHAELAFCRDLLDGPEQERARRFLKEADRNRFTVARAAMRLILGGILDADPRGLVFATGPHGKPRLAAPAVRGPRFNISHAGGLVLIAVATDRPVGVDLEPADRPVDPGELAPRVLAPAEIEALANLPAAARARWFLEIWTAKEAAVKALGKGVFLRLSSFAVPPRAGGARTPTCDSGPAGLDDLVIRPLTPAPGYVGAVAARGGDWETVCWSGGNLFASRG